MERRAQAVRVYPGTKAGGPLRQRGCPPWTAKRTRRADQPATSLPDARRLSAFTPAPKRRGSGSPRGPAHDVCPGCRQRRGATRRFARPGQPLSAPNSSMTGTAGAQQQATPCGSSEAAARPTGPTRPPALWAGPEGRVRRPTLPLGTAAPRAPRLPRSGARPCPARLPAQRRGAHRRRALGPDGAQGAESPLHLFWFAATAPAPGTDRPPLAMRGSLLMLPLAQGAADSWARLGQPNHPVLS